MSQLGPDGSSSHAASPGRSERLTADSADAESSHLWTPEQVSRLVEMERAQWGHDLHDDLLPLLFAARAGAERLLARTEAPEAAASDSATAPGRVASLQQIIGWIDQAMQSGREILSQLQPLDQAHQPWPDAAANRIQLLLGDRVAVDWRVDAQATELPAPLATAAYRITVEAIRNAVQHGKSTVVTVHASLDRRQGCIQITDNGRGFDPDQVVGDHFGIQIMKSRAQLAGGQLRVDSQPGGPTTVAFTFVAPAMRC